MDKQAFVPVSSKQEPVKKTECNRLLHPVTIWKYFSKFSFLLFFPILQAMMKEPLSLLALSNFPWIVSVCVICLMQYFSCRYSFHQENLYYQSGLFLHRKFYFPLYQLSSATIRTTPLLSLFGAAKLQIDTMSDTPKGADLTLTLSKKELFFFWNHTAGKLEDCCKVKNFAIFLMVCSWSNPASGLLLMGLFLQRVAKIWGREISDQLYTTIDQSYRLIALGIPPTIAALGYLLAFGWLIAVFRQFLFYGNFQSERRKNGIAISHGIFARTRRIFSPQSICAVELRQTLLMFLTRRTAAYLHCRGSGRGKDERNLLTTAMKKEKSTQVLSRLLPELHFFVEPITALRPVRGSWKGFLFLPLCEFLGLLLLVSFFPKSIFLPILFFLFLFPLCLFIIRLLGYRKTRLALCGDFLLVSGCHKFSLFTALIERNHLQSIRVTQNPFQKLSKTCSVRFYVGADRKKYFLIRHFRVSMIENFLFSGDFSF